MEAISRNKNLIIRKLIINRTRIRRIAILFHSILSAESLCIFGKPRIHYVSPYIHAISRLPQCTRPRTEPARSKSEQSERATAETRALGILWEPLKVNSPRISFRVVPTDIPSRAARNCAAVRNRIGVSLAKRVYRGERDSRDARIRSSNRNSFGNTKVGHSSSFCPMHATATEGKEKYEKNARAACGAFFLSLLSF